MARRRTSTFEDLIGIVASFPWWAGVALALVSYLWLHHVASQPITTNPGDLKQLGATMSSQLWRTLALYLQYLLPIACLLGSGTSAYRQYVKSPDETAGLSRKGQRTARARPAQGAGAPVGAAPACPDCGAAMVQRQARKGSRAGSSFWGCSRFPACRGIRN